MNFSLIAGIVLGAVIMAVIIALRIKWVKGKPSRKGKARERQVAKILSSLKHKDFIVFNDLILPSSNGHTSQIDHLVISTRGIFIIETKSHAGVIAGSENGQQWMQQLPSLSRPFYNPLLQNAAHIRTVRRLLSDLEPDSFISLVVFTDAQKLNIKADKIIQERRFLPDRHINRTLLPAEMKPRRWWSPSKEVRLDKCKNVLLIHDLADALKSRKKIFSKDEMLKMAEEIGNFLSYDSKAKKDHTKYAKETAKSISREIRQGICPRCQGRLIVRKTENGEFLGCENFPRCKFSCSTVI